MARVRDTPNFRIVAAVHREAVESMVEWQHVLGVPQVDEGAAQASARCPVDWHVHEVEAACKALANQRFEARLRYLR